MTDRELLEAAARAAGLAIKFDPNWDWPLLPTEEGFAHEWNPLEDDAHALRLAVKLSLDVSFLHEAGGINQSCRLIAVDSGGPWTPCVREGVESDPLAATRRAIVRAAAAMEQS